MNLRCSKFRRMAPHTPHLQERARSTALNLNNMSLREEVQGHLDECGSMMTEEDEAGEKESEGLELGGCLRCRCSESWAWMPNMNNDLSDGWDHDIEFLGLANEHAGRDLESPADQMVFCLEGEGHPCREDCGGKGGRLVLPTATSRSGEVVLTRDLRDASQTRKGLSTSMRSIRGGGILRRSTRSRVR